MADEYYLLTDADRAALNRVLQLLGNTRGNPVNRPDLNDIAASWPARCYVAVTPGGGIPALTHPVGTGTDVETVPGSAVCIIQRLGVVDTELESAGFSKTVYNLSTTAVPASTYVLVERDEYGVWWVSDRQPSSSGSSSTTFNGASAVTSGSDNVSLHNSETGGNDTFTTVQWDVPVDGDSSFFALGTDPTILTVHRDGYYLCGFNVTATRALTTGNAVEHTVQLLVGGVSSEIADNKDFAASFTVGTTYYLGDSGQKKLIAGDQLQLAWDIGIFGGALAGGIGWSSVLWIQWLGP